MGAKYDYWDSKMKTFSSSLYERLSKMTQRKSWRIIKKLKKKRLKGRYIFYVINCSKIWSFQYQALKLLYQKNMMTWLPYLKEN